MAAAAAPPPPGPTPPAGSYVPPPPPPPYAGSAPLPPPAAATQAAGLEENLACALCYVMGLLTGVLFLVLAPYNQNRLIRFHAFQSIFVHIASVVVFIGLMIVMAMLHFIPFIGAILGLMLYPIVGLGFFILWLMLMYKAYNRERWVLPIVGPLAEKQA
ncbi:MAG: hypothetical protein ABI833_18105 [Acidobacteriota bacterium]